MLTIARSALFYPYTFLIWFFDQKSLERADSSFVIPRKRFGGRLMGRPWVSYDNSGRSVSFHPTYSASAVRHRDIFSP